MSALAEAISGEVAAAVAMAIRPLAERIAELEAERAKPAQRVLVVAEAAKIVRASQATIRDALNAGELRGTKQPWRGVAGHRWTIIEADLLAWDADKRRQLDASRSYAEHA